MIRCNMRKNRNSLTLCVVVTFLCLVSLTYCDESPENAKKSDAEADKTEKPPPVAPINPDPNKNKATDNNIENNNNNSKNNKDNSKNTTSKPETGTTNITPKNYDKESHLANLNFGALLRGFYVLVGLSVLALAYMVFRSFGLNKQRPQMVRKYGVLAHKQDIEMRPLPLDEDDEDDTTLFDATDLKQTRS